MKRRTTILLAAALLAGCAGGDSDDKDENGGGTDTPAPASDVAVFESPEIGFNFEYPKDWAADKRPDDQVLAQVSLEAGEPLNAIKIRKTADQELGTDRYLDEFQRDFARTVGKVDKREQTIGNIDMGVLEFEDSVEQLGQPVDFSSVSFFFPGGGKTWQVECIADSDHESEIDEACKAALESISFDT